MIEIIVDVICSRGRWKAAEPLLVTLLLYGVSYEAWSTIRSPQAEGHGGVLLELNFLQSLSGPCRPKQRDYLSDKQEIASTWSAYTGP